MYLDAMRDSSVRLHSLVSRASHPQHAILDGELHVFVLEAGKVGVHHPLVVFLGQVHAKLGLGEILESQLITDVWKPKLRTQLARKSHIHSHTRHHRI